MKSLSRVRLCDPMGPHAHQVSLSMGFSRQEYWSGLPFIYPGDILKPGIELGSPALQVDALTSEPSGKPNSILIKLIKPNYSTLSPSTI